MIRVLMFMLALVAGGGALWVYLQQRPAPAPTPQIAVESADEPEMVLVLATTRDIAAGERLMPDSIVWIGWPQDFVIPAFILRDSQTEEEAGFIGWTAREPFTKGEPLRRAALRAPGPNMVSALLAPGMRALAVRVTIEATAGGFIMPGDRVDVLQTRLPPGTSSAESRIVASNVRVIALDQFTQPVDERSILVERTATLELNRSEVERVTAAEQTGNLSLALRALADDDAPPEYAPPGVSILRGGTRSSP